MVRTAYLDFLCSAGGLGMAGSQCLFTLVLNSGLPLATAAVLGVAACMGPLYLTNRVLKGYLFGGLPLVTWGLDC